MVQHQGCRLVGITRLQRRQYFQMIVDGAVDLLYWIFPVAEQKLAQLILRSYGVQHGAVAGTTRQLFMEVGIDGMESRAIAQRLDLQAARTRVDLIGQSLALRTKTRYAPAGIRIGVDTEREPDGQRVTGPILDLELPIFNQGQGEIAKLTAQYRQAQRELEALTVNVRSEVREARDQLSAARDLTSYIGKRLLPTQQKALNLTLEQYNFMLKGAYDLLLAKQNEVAAERSYIEAWRDYWIARADLERAVGGTLSGKPYLDQSKH